MSAFAEGAPPESPTPALGTTTKAKLPTARQLAAAGVRALIAEGFGSVQYLGDDDFTGQKARCPDE